MIHYTYEPLQSVWQIKIDFQMHFTITVMFKMLLQRLPVYMT